jgi:DNA polymerase
LRTAAQSCRGCELFEHATQVVFGAGSASASLMVVGEVPGDKEDQLGQPFVGPAGKLLDEGLAAAGIDRREVYVTNAVKHFKWEPRGKRRLHKKPKTREISACRPWLEAEIEVVKPHTIVCLGAIAAQSLLGREFRITRQRGEAVESEWAPYVIGTWHPSAVLRAPDEGARRRMREELFGDLQSAAESLSRL